MEPGLKSEVSSFQRLFSTQMMAFGTDESVLFMEVHVYTGITDQHMGRHTLHCSSVYLAKIEGHQMQNSPTHHTEIICES